MFEASINRAPRPAFCGGVVDRGRLGLSNPGSLFAGTIAVLAGEAFFRFFLVLVVDVAFLLEGDLVLVDVAAAGRRKTFEGMATDCWMMREALSAGFLSLGIHRQ
jgi:hypothetical protein